MKILNLVQGSPEWHAHRATHFNASDAPAMMGCSPYSTRDELLYRLHTGIVDAEIDAGTAKRFANGHRAEALARPLAEKIIGEELAPLVGVSGKFSASFDGLTMMGDTAWEHKLLGQQLSYTPWDQGNGDHLPLHYRAQLEHQLMVSGAERVLFMASKWADDGTLLEERHCWYAPDPELRQKIVAGWDQFAADLAAYVPPAAAAPKATGRTPENLPALLIEVTGQVTASNLREYKEHALAVFAGINRNLATDQDFADAEQAVKWCADVESRLAAAKQHALSQTASIDELFRTVDEISAEARRVRLELDRLVKAEKEHRRFEIVGAGSAALAAHITELNNRIGFRFMPDVQADFAGAIKGKKSLDSMRSAVNDELARAKIAANEIADRITLNLRTLAEHAEHASLFPDTATLALKTPDDLLATVKSRIADHQAAEAKKAEVAAHAQQAIQQAAAPAAQREQLDADPRFAAVVAGAPAAPAPAPWDADEAPTLKLGDVNARLAPIQVTAEGLRELGIEPAGRDKRAMLYREEQFPAICDAIAERAIAAKRAALLLT